MITLKTPKRRARGEGQESNNRYAWCPGVWVVFFLALGGARAQAQLDVMGSHDLRPGGTSPIQGTMSASCLYCHAPHSGLNGTAGVLHTPLWNQKLSSVQAYTVYSSTTLVNTPNPSPALGTDSTLCLSCHDGTVAGSPGALVAYGQVAMTGQMYSSDMFGTDLSTVHPFSFVLPLKANTDLVASLTSNPPSTADATGAVRLINGNVECTSCHNPHVQNIDPLNLNFLVLTNSSSALCLACHSTVPTGSGMGMTGAAAVAHNMTRAAAGTPPTPDAASSKTNPLAEWLTSIHATAANKVATEVAAELSPVISKRTSANPRQSSLGPYGTVAKNGCSSCHTPHNAQGGGPLLRAADDQTCLSCHNGSSSTSPPTPSILAEMTAPKYGHALSLGNTSHRAHEPALLNLNSHVTCVDCHNSHAAGRVTSFPAAPVIRASQNLVVGISATDGVTVVNPAVNQYENCLRCHGSSSGVQGTAGSGYLPTRAVAPTNPLNVIPEFADTAASSHPVFHGRRSVLPQTSLRPNMLDLDGRTPRRSMGTSILCSDCHNSDDNREFGGNGPNGPHGSIFPHILERRYEFSQAPAPGKLITNLFPNPSLSGEGGAGGGPYALCAKCHDLAQVLNNSTFSEHARHVKNDGFSCSVCHTAHGMGAQSASISGERLVNFDINVVSPNGADPIAYNRASNSCSLVCHNQAHQLRSAGVAGKANFKR